MPDDFIPEWTPYNLQQFPPRRWRSLRGFYWHYRWWLLANALMWVAGGYIVYAVARAF